MKNLNENISEKSLAIIWMTNDHITSESKFFSQINYILDGTLVNNYSFQISNKDIPCSFFSGKSFGKPFFVANFVVSKTSKSDLIKGLKSVVSLLLPHQEKRSEIFIIEENCKIEEDTIKKLQDEFSMLNFSKIAD